jgi:hypothetical protein
VTAMTLLETKPSTATSRTPRVRGEMIPLLIEVPRLDPPRTRGQSWRSEESGSDWARPYGLHRGGRPRRRLRREIRVAGCWFLAMVAMGGTFTMGWMSRGARAARPSDRIVAALAWDDRQSSQGPAGAKDPVDIDAVEIVPAAPVADAEISVILPGYVLPDDSLEEPVHEGS